MYNGDRIRLKIEFKFLTCMSSSQNNHTQVLSLILPNSSQSKLLCIFFDLCYVDLYVTYLMSIF
jgi:hypothetical protein